ncbi:hypothetical protein ACINKY_21440 [Paenibacillus illinoisensis]|uniref:Uncharacterized protein n=1 Tax=Paenibacillus illinoisensis TaxID=59845 RepID=A0ABW8HZT8_9BACL
MKLRPDGTIEGTPEEISEYMRINRPEIKAVVPTLKEKAIEAARAINKDFGSELPKLSVAESFVTKEWLDVISTKQLHEELAKRENMVTFLIPPGERAVLDNPDGSKHAVDGQAFISIHYA